MTAGNETVIPPPESPTKAAPKLATDVTKIAAANELATYACVFACIKGQNAAPWQSSLTAAHAIILQDCLKLTRIRIPFFCFFLVSLFFFFCSKSKVAPIT